MKSNKPETFKSIRSKLLYPFLTMVVVSALVSFFSYYNEQLLLRRINALLTNNIKLMNFSTNIDNSVSYLEKYLVSRNFSMLQKYYYYTQAIDSEYSKLEVVDATSDNYLMLENVRNMTRSFLKQTETAEKAKRARDSVGYLHAFNEVVRYNTNIKWAIDWLITRQLEENSRQYLSISKRLLDIQQFGLVIIISALAFSITVSVWTIFQFTKPLSKLVDAAKAISKGNLAPTPLEVSTNDEVGVVTRTFNEMVSSISRLITEIKHKTDLEIRLQDQELQNLSMKNVLREAELHALQSQINPHFLFNMLNAGVQLAIIENADKTAEFVDKVSTLLRYSLRTLDTPVTIQEELNHLETYFFILKTRYGNERFQFSIRTDAGVLNHQIPLLTLQPLVENALIHGIEDLESGGKIEVKVYKEVGFIVIQVGDNGLGMDSETLTRIQKGDHLSGHTTGLGLHNVRERLRLFYGQEDLFTIQSIPNQGTTIQLRLPLKNDL
jgi:two-component system sensor histidine kinase YesM